MNRNKLKIKLEKLKIDPSFYSLDGKICTGLNLNNSGKNWEVYEMDERGRRFSEKTFFSENDACKYIYQQLLFEKKLYNK